MNKEIILEHTDVKFTFKGEEELTITFENGMEFEAVLKDSKNPKTGKIDKEKLGKMFDQIVDSALGREEEKEKIGEFQIDLREAQDLETGKLNKKKLENLLDPIIDEITDKI